MDMMRAATLFGSNAFSSTVGQHIERATDSALPSEDWALILEICDIINETDEGPKDAVKAIRKRLANQKNYKSILYALTVCEACVKNCGPRFHKHIATKDFLNDFMKLLTQKGQVSASPQIVQEKVLSLVQSWSDAFRNAPDLQPIRQCYETLKSQGHEFPAQDLDKLSPIFTPNLISQGGDTMQRDSGLAASNPPQPAMYQNNHPTRTRTFAPVSAHPPPANNIRPGSAQQPPPTSAPMNPTVEQLGKLRSQLDIVEGNVQVLSEMLTQLQPGQESADDYELLVELNKTCREMQKRVIELVDRIANEEVTGVLLRVNDNLNNVFIRYDRYERNRKALTGQSNPNTDAVPFPVAEPVVESTPAMNNLINFGADDTIDTNSTETYAPNNDYDDEFAQFAQSRTSGGQSMPPDTGSTYEDNIKGVPNEGSISDVMCAKGPYPYPSPVTVDKNATLEDDVEDVEQWLKGTDLSELEAHDLAAREAAANRPPSYQSPTIQTSGDAMPMTSSEFDEFLSNRAMMGSQTVANNKPAPPRQMTNVISGEKTTDEMYGL